MIVLVVLCTSTMKFVIAAVTFLLGCEAFSPRAAFKTSTRLSGISEEFGIPCEEDCALVSYPNLPPSVHPGVVSGQALVDLLNHAKDNGKIDFKSLLKFIDQVTVGVSSPGNPININCVSNGNLWSVDDSVTLCPFAKGHYQEW